jgi:hypothetical protein
MHSYTIRNQWNGEAITDHDNLVNVEMKGNCFALNLEWIGRLHRHYKDKGMRFAADLPRGPYDFVHDLLTQLIFNTHQKKSVILHTILYTNL